MRWGMRGKNERERSFEGGEVETKRKSEFRMTQSAPLLPPT